MRLNALGAKPLVAPFAGVTAKIITGDGHDHKAIWRVDQIAPAGRYTMDDAERIAEMKNRGFTEAREQLPELRRHFFEGEAEPFVPFHSL